MYKINKLKKVLGEKLKEHIPLREYTTIRIGGVADYFFEAKNIEELISAVIAARVDRIPFFVIGWGSNILVSDNGFPGLVIKNSSSNIAFLEDKAQIIADSGVNLSRLIISGINKNLGGMEALYKIPGTVGGAIYGNAGAYRVKIFDFVRSITMLSPKNKIINKNQDWFCPEYRSTRLKRENKKDYVILSVKFQLSHNKKELLLEKIAKIKKEREMRFLGLGPSCGSIFKNPDGGKKHLSSEEAKKNSAGYLLDQIGAKKLKINDAGVFFRHANIIENKGQAKAIDVRVLTEKLREEVRKNSGIELKEEIEYMGQWE